MPRSIFSNFESPDSATLTDIPNEPALHDSPPSEASLLQKAIDRGIARAFVYRFLASAFEEPNDEAWDWLCHPDSHDVVRSAMGPLHASSDSALARSTEALLKKLRASNFDEFESNYVAAFGHTARGECPLNEIEYGDIKADPLFQPHRLADLGAFYSAFGLELAEDADERADHISIELEFMSVLAAKETYAFEHQLDSEHFAICRDTQKKFLREHLGRWVPAFTRRLERLFGETTLGALAQFTGAFINVECRAIGVAPGSEDLVLRPVDQKDEQLCGSCGIRSLPPGAGERT
jgi:DMSO reductase family type II enzyme chaperone